MTVIVEHNGDRFYNVCFKQKGLTGEDRPDYRERLRTEIRSSTVMS